MCGNSCTHHVYIVCLVCWTPLQSALIDLPPWTLNAAWPLQQPVSNWSCSTAVDSHGTPTLHVCVSVCVSSVSSFGWAPSSMPHLANLSIAFRMCPKAIVMGRVLSLYLHASIFTLLSISLLFSYLFFPIQSAALIRRLMKPLSSRSGFIHTAARVRLVIK